MWDKLMGKVWSVIHEPEYRNKVATYTILICGMAILIYHTTSLALGGKWSVGDIIVLCVTLTLEAYFTLYAIKKERIWH